MVDQRSQRLQARHFFWQRFSCKLSVQLSPDRSSSRLDDGRGGRRKERGDASYAEAVQAQTRHKSQSAIADTRLPTCACGLRNVRATIIFQATKSALCAQQASAIGSQTAMDSLRRTPRRTATVLLACLLVLPLARAQDWDCHYSLGDKHKWDLTSLTGEQVVKRTLVTPPTVTVQEVRFDLCSDLPWLEDVATDDQVRVHVLQLGNNLHICSHL